MSATLNNKADLVRAFGRTPDVIIEPNNDAGNGERLILTEREMIASLFNSPFAQRLQQKHKVLVAVPTYQQAREWSSLTEPPEVKTFSESLDKFRSASDGSFILVNRVDGIDLPHKTCRLMILDGLPTGDGLLEKYQFEYLHMKTFASSRIANRLVQLFGRINRGRSDYGAFLIAGDRLNIWLANDKNIALLPDLLKRQILLGRTVQEGMSVKTLDAVSGLLDTVLLSEPRNKQWTDYYSQFLEAQDLDERENARAKRTEERNLEAAKAEAIFARSVWERDYASARVALDKIVAETARADEKLAGWHNFWIASALDAEGDSSQSELYYSRARGQLGLNLIIPIKNSAKNEQGQAPERSIVSKTIMMTNLGRETFNRQMRLLDLQLSMLDSGTSSQMEEAVRLLGETLGFVASRPDNDDGTGPDVLWRDQHDKLVLGIELKTEKAVGSRYSKNDISQSFDHLSWIDKNLNGAKSLGCLLVGPAEGCKADANPSSNLYHTSIQPFRDLRDKLVAVMRDAYEQLPKNRAEFIANATAGLSMQELGQVLGAVGFVK